ncbi:N-acetylmuramoyl-L-alanine amidase [Bacillus sp. ISL-35]|uniref:N-acetylmuramoyl-L-alanine amidase n=1 Tax=Bacillus sp. ISL-35 TaxID=2819122 RepID=UPI001BE87B06|nr:N-acetylmuramoyl-L-alanine amidase [Bacillus sp. ISL-35]MBT2678788.1 N-acetylmuramoyl-L-alanine amidase [Bacillus sp. ISL-35]MBT2703780.1 N-acetylmuramoyl-L-alanine amidase [Chryseobacterium sp. ISL-80]
MKKKGKLIKLGLLLSLILSGCSDGIQEETVVKAESKVTTAIRTETRIAVNKDFMPNMNFVPRSNIPTHIVLHFISNAANNPDNPYVYEDIRKIFIDYNVSPHYMIDRNGEIYHLLPENRAARHAGKGNIEGYTEYEDLLNKYSIGIELMAIGTEEEMQQMMSSEYYRKIPSELIGYTEAQYQALNLLIDDIMARNSMIKRDRNHIIGHDEYAPERKTDPGSLFEWEKIMSSGE